MSRVTPFKREPARIMAEEGQVVKPAGSHCFGHLLHTLHQVFHLNAVGVNTAQELIHHF
jgi:hypothetical protein